MSPFGAQRKYRIKYANGHVGHAWTWPMTLHGVRYALRFGCPDGRPVEVVRA